MTAALAAEVMFLEIDALPKLQPSCHLSTTCIPQCKITNGIPTKLKRSGDMQKWKN
jgi:hypothetical protein